jgi:hypothetical protein
MDLKGIMCEDGWIDGWMELVKVTTQCGRFSILQWIFVFSKEWGYPYFYIYYFRLATLVKTV